ncbi:MAG: hypothetical protein AAGD22_17165 [Verrucomicrobiota bacterium]
MNDPVANSQLELACRLGALDEVSEALEDGADIDFGSGTPLYVAICEGEREVVALLVKRGADVSVFGFEATGEVGEKDQGEHGDSKANEPGDGSEGEAGEDAAKEKAAGGGDETSGAREQLVDALMALVTPAGHDESGGDGGEGTADEDPVNAKVVRAFDRMIRNKGLGEPLVKKREEEYGIFLKGLKWLAAEECELVVLEFLEMVELVGAEAGEEGMASFLEDNAARIGELSERYQLGEDLPVELLKEYLKERKKQAKAEGGE